MTSRKIRIAIIGVGRIAEEVHLPVLLKMPRVQVVAICDHDKQRLEKVRKLFGIEKGYTDLNTMIKEQKLDAVDICSPPGNHRELCLQAFNAGVNVIVEKPFVTTAADADLVISTAKQKNLALHVIHNQSYLPVYIKAKKLLHSGELGEILNVHVKLALPFEEEWLNPDHWACRMPGGPLGEVAPHAVMLFLEFLDTNYVEEIHAVATNANGHTTIKADELIITAKAGKKIGSCCVSNQPAHRTTIDIMGSKVWAFVDGDSQVIVKYPAIGGRDTLARGKRVLSDIVQRSSAIFSAAANVAIGRYRPSAPLGHKYLFNESFKEICGEGVYPISLEQVREKVRILEIAFKQTGLFP
jgi:predicted dehydrogenase